MAKVYICRNFFPDVLERLKGVHEFKVWEGVEEMPVDDLLKEVPDVEGLLTCANHVTPEVFEAFLPYAYALGVENNWCQRFAREIPEDVRRQDGYHPVWYSGRFHGINALNHLGDDFGSSFSSAISSAATAPGSSSGSGGGGFSGGGGGGGGGGGW